MVFAVDDCLLIVCSLACWLLLCIWRCCFCGPLLVAWHSCWSFWSVWLLSFISQGLFGLIVVFLAFHRLLFSLVFDCVFSLDLDLINGLPWFHLSCSCRSVCCLFVAVSVCVLSFICCLLVITALVYACRIALPSLGIFYPSNRILSFLILYCLSLPLAVYLVCRSYRFCSCGLVLHVCLCFNISFLPLRIVAVTLSRLLSLWALPATTCERKIEGDVLVVGGTWRKREQ